jgi:CRP-like cAMP-binding protein
VAGRRRVEEDVIVVRRIAGKEAHELVEGGDLGGAGARQLLAHRGAFVLGGIAAHAFATLGHPGRLAVFRLLMRFAPQGVRPTEIAEALGLKQNTLSHHLADLTASGLVQVERQGRSLFYAVDLDTTEG